MKNSRTLGAAGAAIALVLLGGVAAVQQPVAPKLNPDSVAARLGLSADVKNAIAPRIDELNSAMAGHWQMAQAMTALHARLQEARNSIAAQLTPEQRSAFAAEMARTFGHGMTMGANGAAMGAGRMSGSTGPGAHMGNAGMGGAGMGAGMGAGAMGIGHMGHGAGHMGIGAGMMGGLVHPMHQPGMMGPGSVRPDTGTADDGSASPRQ